MIRFMDSHAYPGCPAVAEDLPQEGSVHVEFSGGTVAAWWRAGTSPPATTAGSH